MNDTDSLRMALMAEEHNHRSDNQYLLSQLMPARKLIERVRRWVSDHPIDPDHPCHCGLCTALRRYDSEVGQ